MRGRQERERMSERKIHWRENERSGEWKLIKIERKENEKMSKKEKNILRKERERRKKKKKRARGYESTIG